MNRKSFLHKSVGGLIGAGFPLMYHSEFFYKNQEQVDQNTIKEFVGAGHRNLDKVQEMLDEIPNLIYCRYDWGGGDFEEAIGGAGHVGNKEIANFLIAQGARVNLFILTMLGKTALVKPVLEEYPQLIFAKGPHGFSLLHHAERGGEEAAELYDYLSSKGLMEKQFKI